MIAFVFSGQGAQKPGMGKSLYEESKKAKEIFDLIEGVRPGIKKLCFDSPQEELNITVNTQPCVFTVDLAAALSLVERGVKPNIVAGFSLGEIAALAFSGVLNYEDACKLVCKRAELMHKDAEKNKGAMAAVLGIQADNVLSTLENFKTVEAVNLNCPGQTVVSGGEEEIDLFITHIKQKGAKVRKLAVSGAFHSSFMNNASKEMGEYLKKVKVNMPNTMVYSNYTALPYPDSEEKIKENIKKQINNPVRWEESIRNMISNGINTFIEVGEGKVLCGLISKIDSKVKVYHHTDVIKSEKNGGLTLC